MFKRFSVPVLVLALLHVGSALGQQPQEYPVLDRIAQKVIDKYANSTCEQLARDEEREAVGGEGRDGTAGLAMLKQDPQMRQYFLNKVAAPIANKMFECGMIP